MSQPNRNIYTAYRGDTYLGEGTIDEIAVLAGVKRSTSSGAHAARPQSASKRGSVHGAKAGEKCQAKVR